jgi:hypothetical protein
MLTTVKFFIVGLFVALLFINLYFRFKVMKYYKVLVQNRVQFEVKHVFNQQKLEDEVLSNNPVHRKDIEGFVGHIRKSVIVAILLIVLITIMGVVLHMMR